MGRDSYGPAVNNNLVPCPGCSDPAKKWRILGKLLIHSLCENKTFLWDEVFYRTAKKINIGLAGSLFC